MIAFIRYKFGHGELANSIVHSYHTDSAIKRKVDAFYEKSKLRRAKISELRRPEDAFEELASDQE